MPKLHTSAALVIAPSARSSGDMCVTAGGQAGWAGRMQRVLSVDTVLPPPFSTLVRTPQWKAELAHRRAAPVPRMELRLHQLDTSPHLDSPKSFSLHTQLLRSFVLLASSTLPGLRSPWITSRWCR